MWQLSIERRSTSDLPAEVSNRDTLPLRRRSSMKHPVSLDKDLRTEIERTNERKEPGRLSRDLAAVCNSGCFGRGIVDGRRDRETLGGQTGGISYSMVYSPCVDRSVKNYRKDG